MDLNQGKIYEIVFSDGSTRRLRYEGFGTNMQQLWRDVSTNQVVHPLPPYVSYKQVD